MTDRAQLEVDVDQWLARDDVAVSGANIDSIFRLAESYIATEVRTVVQETSTQLSANDGTPRSAP